MRNPVFVLLATIMIFGPIVSSANSDLLAQEITDGKLAAVEAETMNLRPDLGIVIQSIQRHIGELNEIQNSLADLEDTGGLNSAIGQAVTIAEDELKSLSASSDMVAATELNLNLSQMVRDLRAGDPRNIIKGVHVNKDLSF